MMKYELAALLKPFIQERFGLEDTKIFLETPKQTQHGDYACNVAFSLAKVLRQNPKMIAEDISEKINAAAAFKDLLIASPMNGFINFKLADAFIIKTLSKTESEITYPNNDHKTCLEYVSANPTGPLHIGHGRWAVLGSALANLLKATGHDVHTEFYINDAGNQIKLFEASIEAVRVGADIPENGYHGAYVEAVAQKDGDALTETIAYQKEVLDSAGVHFDTWFSEKTLHQGSQIDDVINSLKEKGQSFEADGALWFKSSEYGDEKDRVLIKADGNFTYFLVDLAYHFDKIKRGYNPLINIWGADHHGYVKRVMAGVSALCGEQFLNKKHFEIMIGQLVSLKRDGEPVRMSKRTGEMITFDEVIEEIGVDATRYYLVEKSPDTHVDFDLALAVKKSVDNPVYYIQYAHARICTLLGKIEGDTPNGPILELNEVERQLALSLCRVHEQLWDAAQNLAPHKVAQYAYTLAKQFHHFYEVCPVLSEDKNTQAKRIQLLLKVKATLISVLDILGISQPDSM